MMNKMIAVVVGDMEMENILVHLWLILKLIRNCVNDVEVGTS